MCFCYLCRNSKIKNFVKNTLAHSISETNTLLCCITEIQDGRQNWWENDFGEKSPIESTEALWKFFVEIALALPVSKIKAFLHFMKKFKMTAKSVRRISGKTH